MDDGRKRREKERVCQSPSLKHFSSAYKPLNETMDVGKFPMGTMHSRLEFQARSALKGSRHHCCEKSSSQWFGNVMDVLRAFNHVELSAV